jgi:hypothetical protein
MKYISAILAAAALAVIATTTQAQAQGTCSLGNSGVTYNQLGEAAVFKNLAPMGKMNCASARYVMNKWLRRTYQRSSSHRLPTRFWDGYVTWHCYKRSNLRWQCDEYDSGTSFRFTAYRLT